MASWPEVAVDHGMRRQKSLGLIGRFEPLHLSLSSSRRTVRILGTIVHVPARPMTHIGQDRSLGDAIAAQAIGDEPSRFVSQTTQQAIEETLGGRAVSPILHQNVEYDPVLVDRAPQIVQHAAGADEHLIEMPGIAGLRSSPTQSSGEVRTEFQAPMPDALMGHNDAAFSQDQLDVTQTETEHVIQPDGMADDLGCKPMPRKRGGLVCHLVSFARLPLKRQQELTWQRRAASIFGRSYSLSRPLSRGPICIMRSFDVKAWTTATSTPLAGRAQSKRHAVVRKLIGN